MPLEIEQTTLDSGVLVLAPAGQMTMGNLLQRFEWKVDELVKANEKKIVLDMAKIDYLDSSGLGVLVKCSPW